MDIPLRSSHPSYPTLAAIEASLTQFRDKPIELIWGMKDWCFSHHFLDRFLEFFPAAEVHRLADAGHYVMEDAPEQVIPLVEAFLEKHPATGGIESSRTSSRNGRNGDLLGNALRGRSVSWNCGVRG